MTDGRASHRSRFITPPELAALRTQEAHACARVMAVPEENLLFLEFEERRLCDHRREALEKIAEILTRLQPAEIFVPFHREAQADHRETCEIVCQAAQKTGVAGEVEIFQYFVWAMRLWFWQIAEIYRPATWLKTDIQPVRRRKLEALAQYRSQTTPLYSGETWPVLPKDLRVWCEQSHEFFLHVDKRMKC
jgi:LmbE family N-acetylglucosaminyl deacetylase